MTSQVNSFLLGGLYLFIYEVYLLRKIRYRTKEGENSSLPNKPNKPNIYITKMEMSYFAKIKFKLLTDSGGVLNEDDNGEARNSSSREERNSMIVILVK